MGRVRRVVLITQIFPMTIAIVMYYDQCKNIGVYYCIVYFNKNYSYP
jgi:hypothetical protein